MKKLAMAVLGAALLSQTAGCFIFVSDEDEGQFHATWTVVAGVASTCEAVGAAYVEILSTEAATSDLYVDRFNCNAYGGTTDPLPLGDYSIVINILDSAGTKLNEDMTPISDYLEFDGEVVELGNVTYNFIPPTADITLHTLWGTAADTTCASHGVAQQQIYLLEGTTCVSYTLTTPYGTGNTCATTDMVCADGADDQIISGVDVGSYTLEVYGLKSATGGYTCACYFASQDITVSADGTIDIDVLFNETVETNPDCYDGGVSKCSMTKF